MNATEGRPDPDDLLAKVEAGERASEPGRLKVFFGYCAGVGKTYRMLLEARALAERGQEVVVGWVEPHERPETMALLEGLQVLPPREVEHRGVRLEEFDLDLALLGRPALVVVDELAHTNAPGSRHAKRWQDVEELLQAGIDVHSSLNVQHLESLNDVVARISGIVVRETVPDKVFDTASEVELVDLPPEDLMRRFREGKVYLPERAEIALQRFFKPETLVALRELALRKTADHVNRQVELGRRGIAARPIWATRERILVGVGPSPTSARLVRAARRIAGDLRAPWYAAHFESSAPRVLPRAARQQLERNLELAERLGAEVVTLRGLRAADELVRFARRSGVTKLVLGKSPRRRFLGLLPRPSLVDEVLRLSAEIDVFVIRGEEESERPARVREVEPPPTAHEHWRNVALLVLVLGTAIGLGLAFRALGLSAANIVLLFLAATVVVATRAGPRASIVAALLAVLTFNFFFTEPRFTFVVHDLEYVLTFGILLTLGLLASGLVGRLRRQASAAREQAEANRTLYRIGAALSSTAGTHQLAERARREIERWFGMESAIFLGIGEQGERRLGDALGAPSLAADTRERSVASWVLRNGHEAGVSTDTLPGARAYYIPLVGTREEPLGALGVVPGGPALARGQRRVLASIASLVALALERELLSSAVAATSVRAETERLRADLLAAVSHDLRTPLATIQGAASTLLERERTLAPDARAALLQDVLCEAERLARLVENLLQLGRVGDGKLELRRDRFPLEELVGPALDRLRRGGPIERIRVSLPEEPLLLHADGDLVIQLIWNLLDNALRYAPQGPIELAARRTAEGGLELEVLDRGPGLPRGDPERLFERFVRGEEHARMRGSGLGLAIGRAIARVHGGELRAEDRPGGGARFVLTLPPSCLAEAAGAPDRGMERAP